jgi:hypothetical protein
MCVSNRPPYQTLHSCYGRGSKGIRSRLVHDRQVEAINIVSASQYSKQNAEWMSEESWVVSGVGKVFFSYLYNVHTCTEGHQASCFQWIKEARSRPLTCMPQLRIPGLYKSIPHVFHHGVMLNHGDHLP